MGWLDRLRGRTDADRPPRALQGTVREPGEPEYATDREQRREDRRTVDEAAHDDMQARHEAALAGHGYEAHAAQERDVRGKPFHLWPDTVRQFKREGRTDEALTLLHECIAAAERDRGGREPAPWYTEHAAIIYRQRGDLDAEVAVLERWLRVTPPERRESKISERLVKAVALRDKKRL